MFTALHDYAQHLFCLFQVFPQLRESSVAMRQRVLLLNRHFGVPVDLLSQLYMYCIYLQQITVPL